MRTRPGAGGVDDVAGGPGLGVRLDDQRPVGLHAVRCRGAAHGLHADRTLHIEVEALLVVGEVGGEDVAAAGVRVRGRYGKPRQLVDAVDRRHLQRSPAMPPRAAGPVLRVEHNEGAVVNGRSRSGYEPAALQVIGRRQPRLTSTNDEHIDRPHTRYNRRGNKPIPAGSSPPIQQDARSEASSLLMSCATRFLPVGAGGYRERTATRVGVARRRACSITVSPTAGSSPASSSAMRAALAAARRMCPTCVAREIGCR